jgi:hypothetical protein
MIRRGVLLLASLLTALSVPAAVRGEDAGRWQVSFRSDTVIRWAPRYVLTVDEGPQDPGREYWRLVEQLPLYERVVLDVRWHGAETVAFDAHVVGWGALDLTFQEDQDLFAGDIALAYANVRLRAFDLWAGRRFVFWGRPGGIHLDGGGVAYNAPFGLAIEAAVGRPVTSVVASLLGPAPSFSEATVAYGARLSYRHEPGVPADSGATLDQVSVSAAYLETWAKGIAADRLASLDARWRPLRRLDLRGGLFLDVNDLVVEQGTVQAFSRIIDRLEVALAYAYVNPIALIPRWSILSVFSSSTFHEVALGINVDAGSSWDIHGEGALRVYDLPGDDVQQSWLGYRFDLAARWVPTGRPFLLSLRVSRRADDTGGFTVAHAAGRFDIHPTVELMIEVAAAIDDDRDLARDSVLGRAALDVAVSQGWTLGASFDAVHSPIADAELRGLVRASWRHSWRGDR